jgi:hypothetical protein
MAQPAPSFTGRIDYVGIYSPHEVLPADLNRDGNIDLLITKLGSPAYIVKLGNGDGTFRDAPLNPAGQGEGGCATMADLNEDGKLDVVVCSASVLNFYIGLGNGDGTFGPLAVVPIQHSMLDVATADLNSDGHLDLVGTSEGLSVRLGRGDGTFLEARFYAFASGWAGGLALADFNLDGRIDVVAGLTRVDVGQQPAVLLYPGDGQGGFGAPKSTAFPPGTFSLVSRDFNRDGKPDLAGNCYSAACHVVLLGNGDGTFGPPAYLQGGPGTGIASGDLNKDGIWDLAVSNGGAAPPLSVFFGRGDGRFVRGDDYVTGGINIHVSLADSRNKGRLDIINVNALENSFSIHFNCGGATSTTTSRSRTRVM